MSTRNATRITIIRGGDADALLAADPFRAAWARLVALCPWATGFQSHAFAAAWYGAYRERFEPVLLVARRLDGELDGLLALARAATTDRLVVAGAHQAEYQGWICRPELSDAFPADAVRAIDAAFPSRPLAFHYLPAGTPMAWLDAHEAAPRCVLRTHARPLLRLGDGSFAKSLLKERSIRPRYRRLLQMGMTLRRVTDPTAFKQIFDQLIGFYDFRRLAVGGSAPFANDPCKKPFHLAMLRHPELAHATVLTVEGQLVGLEFNICGRREIHLALGAQNPWFGKQAPGKVHVPLLAEMLLAEGYDQIDLTPGGDFYKETIANAEDEVFALTICPSRLGRRRVELLEVGKAAAKSLLGRYGIQPGRAQAVARDVLVRHPTAFPAAALRAARGWFGPPRQTLVYCRPTREADHAAPPPTRGAGRVRRDVVDDLMAYQPGWTDSLSRLAFCLDAQRRCADGQHSYTQLDRRGRLAHVAWLADRPSQAVAGQWLPGLTLPPDTAVIVAMHRVRTERRPRRGGGPEVAALRAMLGDAAVIGRAARTLALVPCTDEPVRAALNDLGFVRIGAVFQSNRFGQSRRWAQWDAPAAPDAPPAPTPAPAGPASRGRGNTDQGHRSRDPMVTTSTVGGLG